MWGERCPSHQHRPEEGGCHKHGGSCLSTQHRIPKGAEQCQITSLAASEQLRPGSKNVKSHWVLWADCSLLLSTEKLHGANFFCSAVLGSVRMKRGKLGTQVTCFSTRGRGQQHRLATGTDLPSADTDPEWEGMMTPSTGIEHPSQRSYCL